MTRMASWSSGPVDADAEHRDGRQPLLLELAEQGVLLAGQPLVDLLQREDVPVVGDEPDDVPRDAALRHLQQQGRVPLLERLVPGQRQQPGRVGGRGPEEEPHGALPTRRTASLALTMPEAAAARRSFSPPRWARPPPPASWPAGRPG